MRKTSHSLDATASEAIDQMSARFSVSKAEIVRRCVVACRDLVSDPQQSTPPKLTDGYGPTKDGREPHRETSKDGQSDPVGSAPPLSDLSDGSGELDAEEGMDDTEDGSSESDQRGNNGQDGESGSLLDRQII